MTRAAPLVVLALAAALLAPGCATDDAPQPAPTDSVERRAERGPITVVARAAPPVVEVGARIEYTLDVTAPEGIDVELPVAREKTLGPFDVRDVRTTPDVPTVDGRRWTRTFVLDSFTAGEAVIPALDVRYVDQRDPANITDGAIPIGPITLTVTSALDEGEPLEWRDIHGQVAVRVPPSERAPLVRVALALLVLGGFAALLPVALARRRRRGGPVAPLIPAPEWARRALADLRAAGLIEAADWEAFYDRLSAIVRRYIERRFAIMAPEQTTDEFLRAARHDPALTEAQRDELAGFLRAADLVKFARYEPSPDEAEGAFAAAERFVDETAHEGVAP